jgi:8-oxo-dGTP pyrophosphatase MutT (NUDIX family)
MGDRNSPPSAKLFRLSHVRKLRECEQVAAVCYRVREGEIEFLLVRTGNGHWTFPKGGVEPGLTHAQAAALEAFEEAGVHGRMEEVSFARYVRRKGRGTRGSAGGEIGTSAHLCEVLRLVQPQESDRTPTWSSIDKTKKKLLEGRGAEFGVELIRVVDVAVARIQRLSHSVTESDDAIRRVQFEAAVEVSSQRRMGEFAESQIARSGKSVTRGTSRAKVLQIGPALVVNAVTVKRLSGASSANPAASGKVENGKAARRVAKASFNASKKRD